MSSTPLCIQLENSDDDLGFWLNDDVNKGLSDDQNPNARLFKLFRNPEEGPLVPDLEDTVVLPSIHLLFFRPFESDTRERDAVSLASCIASSSILRRMMGRWHPDCFLSSTNATVGGQSAQEIRDSDDHRTVTQAQLGPAILELIMEQLAVHSDLNHITGDSDDGTRDSLHNGVILPLVIDLENERKTELVCGFASLRPLSDGTGSGPIASADTPTGFLRFLLAEPLWDQDALVQLAIAEFTEWGFWRFPGMESIRIEREADVPLGKSGNLTEPKSQEDVLRHAGFHGLPGHPGIFETRRSDYREVLERHRFRNREGYHKYRGITIESQTV